MSAIQHDAVRTIMQMLQARQMFIGDEIRVSSLRLAWQESGQTPESFGEAVSEMKRLAYIRQVHGTAGPSLQLTKTGFRAFTSQALRKKMVPQPAATPRQAAATAATRPLATQSLATQATKPAPKPAPQVQTTTAPAPAASSDASTQATPSQITTTQVTKTKPTAAGESIENKLQHANVFRTRAPNLNDNILRYCLIGLLKQYRLRPGGTVSFQQVMQDWEKMDLTEADLLCAADILIKESTIRTLTHPEETMQLTTKGHQRCWGNAETLNDGLDRFQASKRLRKTKHLGSMSAA